MPTTIPPAVNHAALAQSWCEALLASSTPIVLAEDYPGAATARGFVAAARARGVAASFGRSPSLKGRAVATLRGPNGGTVIAYIGGVPGRPQVRAELYRVPTPRAESPAALPTAEEPTEAPPAPQGDQDRETDPASLLPASDPAVSVLPGPFALVRNADGCSLHRWFGGDHVIARPVAWFAEEQDARAFAALRAMDPGA